MFNNKVKEYGVKKLKNPGAIPVDVKVRLMKVDGAKKKGDHYSMMKIKELERNSYFPYGKFNSYGTIGVTRQVLLR